MPEWRAFSSDRMAAFEQSRVDFGCREGLTYECQHLFPQALFTGNDSFALSGRDQCINLCCIPWESHRLTTGGRPNWYNELVRWTLGLICGGTPAWIEANNPNCVAQVRLLLFQSCKCCPMSYCKHDSPCADCLNPLNAGTTVGPLP